MKKHKGLVLLIVSVMLMSLVACGSSTGGSTNANVSESTAAKEETTAAIKEETTIASKEETTTAATDQKDEKTESTRNDLKFLISYEPTALSPGAANKGIDMTICGNLHDTLIFEDGANRSSFVPGIASAWEWNDDGTELKLTIRDDVKFHDGTLLTVDDVMFSLGYDLDQAPNASAKSVVKDYKITGENEVTIYLNYAYKPLVNYLALPCFSMISKDFYEKCQADGTNFLRVENGTGPYILDEWVAGSGITMHANEDWFYGEVPIKNVTFMAAQDSTTAAMMMENGQADAYFSPAASDVRRLDDLDNVDNTWPVSISEYAVMFNCQEGPFTDPKLREAIAYGIDRAAILQGGYSGIGVANTYPCSVGFFGYEEGWEVPEYDLDKAKQLLEEAGYPEGSLSITMKVSSDSWYSLPAQVIQAQFEDMGISCELETMDNGAFLTDVINDHNFEVTYYASSAFINDADPQFWDFYHTDAIYNLAGISNPEIDNALETARHSLDDNERLNCYHTIAELNRDNNWYIYIQNGYNSMVYNTALKGVFGVNAGIYKLSNWSW